MSITARGGYQVVDLKNIAITEDGVEIPGIYEQALNCVNKPVQLTNITFNVNGNIRHMDTAQFITCVLGNNGVVTGAINLIDMIPMITINDDDVVTYHVMGH